MCRAANCDCAIPIYCLEIGYNYKYKLNVVKHGSINYFIKVYFLHCFVKRHVSALVMSHLQVDYFS